MDNCSFRREVSSKSIRANELPHVKGFEISKDIPLSKLADLYKTIGFQATHIGQAADILRTIKQDNIPLFLTCTSNMMSSGLREPIAQLVRHKKIAAIITTTGFIEEDIMKSKKPFLVGSFDVDDTEVKANGLNRIGNLFVADEQYCDLEDFHMAFLKEMSAKTLRMSPSDYIKELGKRIADEHSVLHWATLNNIPIYCPGFVDGALGDHFFFFNQNRKEPFVIDTTADLTTFYKQILAPKQTAGLFLGGGIAKHHLIGAAILRDGLDYAVYMQTGTPGDGSLSGARPTEAVSWNKLKNIANSTCIEADATIVFPLLAVHLLD